MVSAFRHARAARLSDCQIHSLNFADISRGRKSYSLIAQLRKDECASHRSANGERVRQTGPPRLAHSNSMPHSDAL